MGGKHKKCQEVECGLIASFGIFVRCYVILLY